MCQREPGRAIFEPVYTCTKLWQICFQADSFGRLSVHIWIRPLSNPSTPSQSYIRFASKRLHLDTFLSRSRASHFKARIHLHKTMAGLLSNCFIWTPFCPDLDQASFEPRYICITCPCWAFDRNQTIVFGERGDEHPFGPILFVAGWSS